MTPLMTQLQELFATCSDMYMLDGLLVTTILDTMDEFGWTTFSAIMKHDLKTQYCQTLRYQG